ncbi:MarR family winged helix-turn-helix transcriptional regulator [Acrocarpospora sp. B8E8]|uniref:MarR family winged helix-turn-helix transcriptional regulator n=1 Tax=Acrocarpospora sp. B8E8 TaxID=3153572 RepID=UPI00325C5AB4
MSTTPILNGQVLGQAHYATRAVLERELARIRTSFQQSVALNAVANNGGVVGRDWLLDRMTSTLKIDESAALETLTELTDAGLVEVLPDEQPRVHLTKAGQALQHQISDAVADITARLYADIPAENMAVAGHVLTLVTQRANAELAATKR